MSIHLDNSDPVTLCWAHGTQRATPAQGRRAEPTADPGGSGRAICRARPRRHAERHRPPRRCRVYRRFPDKTQLIEALFEQRLEQIRQLLEEALEEPDPWRGLTRFHERALELQAHDRGLAQLVLGAPGAPERLAKIRTLLQPLAGELVERARAAGQLRADSEAEDFPIVQVMLSAVIDAGREVAPELWRRYLAIVLQGLRAKPAPPEPLTTPPVPPEQVDEVLAGAWKRRP